MCQLNDGISVIELTQIVDVHLRQINDRIVVIELTQIGQQVAAPIDGSGVEVLNAIEGRRVVVNGECDVPPRPNAARRCSVFGSSLV